MQVSRQDPNNLVLGALRAVGYNLGEIDVERFLNITTALEADSDMSIPDIRKVAQDVDALFQKKVV